MPDNMGKNGEGYPDPTAGSAWRNIRKEENRREMERTAVISNLIPIMKQTAELAGFEVVGRIVLKDKQTGKEYSQKCGKKLTDPESMRRGYGPECWSQISGISTADSGGVGNEADLPGQMTIFDFPDAIPRGEQNE